MLLSPSLLAVLSLSTSEVLLIPLFLLLLFGFLIAIPLSGIRFARQREKMWHETARIALEKGQPMPPHPDAPRPASAWPDQKEWRCRHRRHDIKGGLVLIALGVGLFVALLHVAPDHRYFAAIPAFIGVALLLNALIDARFNRNSDEPIEHPPQS